MRKKRVGEGGYRGWGVYNNFFGHLFNFNLEFEIFIISYFPIFYNFQNSTQIN